MLEEIIVGLRTHMGLKQIDAFWISHMHGDHFLLGPELKEKYGAKAWTLDRIADKCEFPRRGATITRPSFRPTVTASTA